MEKYTFEIPENRDTKKLQKRRIARKRLLRRKRMLRRLILLSGAFLLLAAVLIVGICISRKQSEKAALIEAQQNEKAQQLERLEDAQDKLDAYYGTFAETAGLTQLASKQETAFSDWLLKTYFSDASNDTLHNFVDAILGSDVTEQLLYQWTKNSTHVLSDRYCNRIGTENQIYERKGKVDGEAEITIAGDLCFAEDGFVLDYYDQVKDLSKCISPQLLEMMNQTDLFYLNHEYCVSDRGAPLNGKYYTFRAKPERMKLLKEMGTDLVALANNHVFDYGEDALIDTTKHLTEAGIPYVGGGINIDEAKRPIYFIVNGIKIGFVGASNAEKFRYTPQATETSGGILRAYDTTEYNEVIQKASKECDYLIAYIHWGTEDSNYLNDLQQRMGREFLNSGADIIVGGHPHVLQGMEYVDGKPIIYSLGDFWFNSETKYTGLLKLQIRLDGLKEMSFVPALQTNYTTQYLETLEKQRDLYDFLEKLSINVQIDDDGVITEK